ncbi:hypothetical protein PROFUN_00222 [Planoprotostelium fungivorum]|uniref:Uncharacterized protein n=1 Tax=Planoprotostelium fungivorum TaxID=1890364 RepID=A0A2P6NXS1_9EUKA|nr:hypothetical protein PROFUN_00222 [Planoprotostelium fungivorum]
MAWLRAKKVFQKCVEQYDNPDAKYEQYKIIPYSGLRNSAYEKELSAVHTTSSHYKQSNSVKTTAAFLHFPNCLCLMINDLSNIDHKAIGKYSNGSTHFVS